ncbi:MAG: hypothetical protein Q9170_005227 [Blastenia crenularia]
MFYARAALNAKGKVRFGLRHIHVLNRFSNRENTSHTIQVMMYIFPRQFGLHNVFTSNVDSSQTTQPFLDYTLRESEIARKGGRTPDNARNARSHLPKRLRGNVFDLVKKMQKLHYHCAYYELLKHYCFSNARRPMNKTSTSPDSTQKSTALRDIPESQMTLRNKGTQTPMNRSRFSENTASLDKSKIIQHVSPLESPIVDHATPFSNVSAFCRAVLAKLIPNDFWGQGVDGNHNKAIVMYNVDRFIRLRRFESLTLHAVVQDLKTTSMDWLATPQTLNSAKISSSDFGKRKELLFEFLYYVFDSLLIPLVRSNFHVTESNHHKNRIFYFRHDVWRVLTEPTLARIKSTMFEEIPMVKARQLLDARTLGFSQIRLLPKGENLRPIMNLRRRVTKLQGGKAVLGRSINSIVAPVHKMLDYERQQNPLSVGSALFSVGDMYPKLKAFRKKLCSRSGGMPPLYFAKVDVKSCFDTIPQRSAVRIMQQLATENVYRIARHAQIKASDTRKYGHGVFQPAKPARKFLASAYPPLDFRSFDEMVEETFASERKNTVFVDNVLRTAHKKQKLLDLLKDHVERNIVRIGKKFFRQKSGIPQGSVLSSLLCNCFYARLESERLSFVNQDDSLLLRLIDDFLLVTTSKEEARQFLQTMHDGIEEYGVQVNPTKSFANFSVKINGVSISTATDTAFPYCGTSINTRTLEISKDRNRGKATALADSLTVEQSTTAGQIFHRKAMNAFKIQTHKMFLDTNFGSITNVLNNIYQNFYEASMKYYRYIKSLQHGQQPHDALLIDTIQDLIDMAFVLFKAKYRSQTSHDYACAVSKRQVRWLALTAFSCVLGRKQTKFQRVLEWVRGALEEVRPKDKQESVRLTKVAQRGQKAFRGFSSCEEHDLALHSFHCAGIDIIVEPPIINKQPVFTSHALAVTSPKLNSPDLDRCITIAYDEMTSLATQAPSSPPGLTGSKSSKSSSFHSSSHNGADGLLSDITHFEDIGLDEEPVPSTRELYGYESSPKRPPPQIAATTLSGRRNDVAAMTKTRELTAAGQRLKPTDVQGQRKALSGLGIIHPLPVPGPNGFKKGHRSPSSPSLAQQAMSNLSRSRSPSPSHSSARSAMLHPLQRPATLQGPIMSPVVRNPPTRRGSWQPSRKSIKELEDEYNDSDEDLPDEASLWNVPLSPRPPQERSGLSPGASPGPSTNTSPERPPTFNPSKGSLKDLRSPRMAPVSVNGSSSTVKPFYPSGLSAGIGPDRYPFPKTRAKSWTVAMSELSDEAKSLTEALESHVDQSEKSYEEAVQNGLAPTRPSIEKKSRSKTSVELPPLRVNNIMIDPLPISREKEKVLSRTRPSWLPPKDQKEEKKHLKEYQRMMESSLEAERKRAARAAVQKCKEDDSKVALLRIWEEHVLPNWDQATREPRTRELWWRGIAPRSRAKVWQKAIGNDLALTEATYTKALQRAKEMQARIARSRDIDPPNEKAWFDAIRRDVDTINNSFPELKIFQSAGPLYDGLVDVLMAYSMYRSDVGYSHGSHLLAALLLLILPSAYATFITLANFLNRALPLAFLTGDPAACAKAYSLVFALLEHKYPRLHAHLFSPEELNIHPHEIFEPMLRTLFLGPGGGIGIEAASRVWDVMVFDGDAAVVRTVVGVLGWLEPRLFGMREEVMAVLGWRGGAWGVEKDVEGFMRLVRDAGKERKQREKK